jgi:hypothetical protein
MVDDESSFHIRFNRILRLDRSFSNTHQIQFLLSKLGHIIMKRRIELYPVLNRKLKDVTPETHGVFSQVEYSELKYKYIDYVSRYNAVFNVGPVVFEHEGLCDEGVSLSWTLFDYKTREVIISSSEAHAAVSEKELDAIRKKLHRHMM